MNSISKFAILLVIVGAVILGCGGGGGGAATTSSTSTTATTSTTSGTTGTPPGPGSYTSTWVTPESGAVTGQSQRITITDVSGDVIQRQVMNQGVGAQTITFPGINAGTFILRAELNSAQNFTGTTTGVLETKIQPNFQVSTVVGSAVRSLVLGNASLALDVNQPDHLAVSGVDSKSRMTFCAPASLSMSGTGTVTCDSSGNVKGVGAGPGSIAVTLSGLSAPITVPVTVSRAKWTILIFLNSSNDLFPYAVPNILQMQSVTPAYVPGASTDVRFVVQWKLVAGLEGNSPSYFDGTRRYVVTHDASPAVSSQLVQDLGTSVDMGQAQTLNDFIKWGQATYPADHYALVVWNHGNGWERAIGSPPPTRGVSYDDATGNAIQTWQLPAALQGTRVDILSYDACLMQMLEVAAQTQPYSDLIATSEENTPGPGYPYDRVFASFFSTPTATPTTLAASMVNGHVNYPPYATQAVTQSVVDTSKIPALETAVDQLAAALIANVSSLTTIVPHIRATALKYASPGDTHNYYDLYQIADMLQTSTAPAAVQSAALNVKNAVTSAVLAEGHTTLDAGSHGIAIDFSAGAYFKQFEQLDYDLLKLNTDTRWGQWLAVAP